MATPDAPGASPEKRQGKHLLLTPAWKISFTVLLLALLLSRVDVGRVVDLLREISPWWLVGVVAIQMADRWLMAWKWRFLLNAEEEYIGTATAFKIYYIAGFQGFIVPFGVGPDLVRFARLRGSRIPQERLAASLILERVIGSVATAIAAVLSLGLLLYLLRDATPGWVIPGALTILLVVLLSLVFMRSARLRGWVSRLPGARRLRRFEHSPWWFAIAAYRDRQSVLLRFFGWSVVEQYMTVLAVWFTAMALGVPLGLLACVAAVPIIQLLERLPLTVMGLGVREGSFALLMGLLGVGYSEAILLAMLEFAVFAVALLPAGAWDILSRKPLAEGLGSPLDAPEGDFSSVMEKGGERR